MQSFVALLPLFAHLLFWHADVVDAGRKFCYRKEKIELVALRRNSTSQTLEPVMIDIGECEKGNFTNAVCVPYEVTKHRVYVMAPAIIEPEIIRSCQSASNVCQRLPRLVTFYNGTNFEATVDIGMCSGLCNGKTLCQAFRSKTKSIPSANGDRCIKIVDDCTCVDPSCYRVSQYEGFAEEHTDSQGNIAVRTKIIDVGKCVSFGNARCPRRYLRSQQSAGSPALNSWQRIARGEDTQCYTKRSKEHFFVTTDGKNSSVRVVETCTCV